MLSYQEIVLDFQMHFGVEIAEGDPMLDYLAMFDALRLAGYVILIKWDGGRKSNPHTVMVSGPETGLESIRKDSKRLIDAIQGVLSELLESQKSHNKM